uniref:CCHC-type domain-containing protein n=1 Tax=Trichuris muris TaxID=70415 RepID=A0A5S6PZN5_TRIMR
MQCMEENSRAREVVESFPPTGGNYPKVVESLKSRFGRTELLVEVYVRKMLTLVLRNATRAEPLRLSSLYVKLESYMRALETLGVTTESHVATIFHLVESCLPEELLRAWQRSNRGQHSSRENRPLAGKLKQLMEFLRGEVEGQDRIALAMGGFNLNSQQLVVNSSKPKTLAQQRMLKLPSSTCLFSRERGNDRKCVFCSQDHDYSACTRVDRLSLSEKKRILKRRRCCFVCLAPGHMARECTTFVSCSVCQGRHKPVLCSSMKRDNRKADVSDREQSHVLTNAGKGRVLLQTLATRLVGPKSCTIVRVLVNTGSQRSYLTKLAASRAGYKPAGRRTFAQSLFGGAKSGLRLHSYYKIRLESLDREYVCRFVAYDEPDIFCPIRSVPEGPWINDLRKNGITLSDDGNPYTDIDVLIGADMAGKVYTGNLVRLESGLTAMETRLGWTVVGISTELPLSEGDAMAVTALFVQDAEVHHLWQIDVIDIEDPGRVRTKREMEEATRTHFLQTVSIDRTGRYLVHLPWKEARERLPDNFQPAQRRLIAITKRLRSDGLFSSYNEVFDEWEREGIMEEVRTLPTAGQCHYLPHRPVIKENSRTTKIRPVFDASAKQGNEPSLNDCLETGPNMMQLLPNVMLHFRKGKIGVVSFTLLYVLPV